MPKIGESVPCNTAPFRIFLVNVELCLDQRDCRRGITAVGAFCNPSGWRSIPNGFLLQFAARHKHCRTTTALAWEFSCNQNKWAWNKVIKTSKLNWQYIDAFKIKLETTGLHHPRLWRVSCPPKWVVQSWLELQDARELPLRQLDWVPRPRPGEFMTQNLMLCLVWRLGVSINQKPNDNWEPHITRRFSLSLLALACPSKRFSNALFLLKTTSLRTENVHLRALKPACK